MRRTWGVAAAVLAALMVIGAVVWAVVPERLPAQTVRNVAYAPASPEGSRGHLLDLYLPEGRAKRPLVIWTSGSAWMSDDGKAGAAKVAPYFTAAGYAVAGVSVRSSSQVQFPGQLHDVKAAIRWLRANADRYRLDPDRFAIMGNSSGGWVAAMAAVTSDMPGWEGDVGVRGPSSRVQVAVDFYGPTDFVQMDAHMLPGACERFNQMMGVRDCHSDMMSPESRLMGCAIVSCPTVQANPVAYVHRGQPPLLIMHGQDDQLVPEHQSVLLYEETLRRGGVAVLHSIPGVGHEHPYVDDPSRAKGQTVRAACGGREAFRPEAAAPTWAQIERFIRGGFGVQPSRCL